MKYDEFKEKPLREQAKMLIEYSRRRGNEGFMRSLMVADVDGEKSVIEAQLSYGASYINLSTVPIEMWIDDECEILAELGEFFDPEDETEETS